MGWLLLGEAGAGIGAGDFGGVFCEVSGMVHVVYETEVYLPVSAEPVTRWERSKVAERGPERLELWAWRVVGSRFAIRLCEI